MEGSSRSYLDRGKHTTVALVVCVRSRCNPFGNKGQEVTNLSGGVSKGGRASGGAIILRKIGFYGSKIAPNQISSLQNADGMLGQIMTLER
jgi:hypothetical protein